MCGSVAARTRLGLEPTAEDLVQRDPDRGVDHERAPLHHGSPGPRVLVGPRKKCETYRGEKRNKGASRPDMGVRFPSHGEGQARVYGVEERLDAEDGDALQVEADQERLPGVRVRVRVG